MTNQTSIEWLIKKITNEIMNEEYIDKLSIEKTNLLRNYVKQAKEMHKQEIIDAYYQCGRDNFEHIKVINRSATEYYQETFGSKGSDEVVLPQQEISDEEVENEVKKINLKFGASFSYGFILGVKWYREQLKKK